MAVPGRRRCRHGPINGLVLVLLCSFALDSRSSSGWVSLRPTKNDCRALRGAVRRTPRRDRQNNDVGSEIPVENEQRQSEQMASSPAKKSWFGRIAALFGLVLLWVTGESTATGAEEIVTAVSAASALDSAVIVDLDSSLIQAATSGATPVATQSVAGMAAQYVAVKEGPGPGPAAELMTPPASAKAEELEHHEHSMATAIGGPEPSQSVSSEAFAAVAMVTGAAVAVTAAATPAAAATSEDAETETARASEQVAQADASEDAETATARPNEHVVQAAASEDVESATARSNDHVVQAAASEDVESARLLRRAEVQAEAVRASTARASDQATQAAAEVQAEAVSVDDVCEDNMFSNEVELPKPVVPGMEDCNLVVGVETEPKLAVPKETGSDGTARLMASSHEVILGRMAQDGWTVTLLDKEKSLFEIKMPAVKYDVPVGSVQIPQPSFQAIVRDSLVTFEDGKERLVGDLILSNGDDIITVDIKWFGTFKVSAYGYARCRVGQDGDSVRLQCDVELGLKVPKIPGMESIMQFFIKSYGNQSAQDCANGLANGADKMCEV